MMRPSNSDSFHFASSPGSWLRFAVLLLGLLLLAFSGHTWAKCKSIRQPGVVSFALPATHTLPNTLTNGTVLLTSSPVSPSPGVVAVCHGNTDSGIEEAPIGGGNTRFPTTIPGLSFEIVRDNSNSLKPYPDETLGPSVFDFSGLYRLELRVTDAAAFAAAGNHTLAGGQIARWVVDCSQCQLSKAPVVTFNISEVAFVTPSCNVTTPSQTVPLPTVMSGQFSGTGSTAGEKDFSIQLYCPASAAGADVAITLSSNDPFDDQLAVINNGGSAQGVGVQVLDGNGNTIAFGPAIDVGTASAGNFDIPLKARYYQTGESVKGGSVSATVNYTITYP